MRGKVILVPWALLIAALVSGPAGAEESDGEQAERAPEGNPSIRLESTFVGDKEQPAVSYFVPWQGTSTPDKLQWSLEDKHDATLQPVDREVLERSVNIYQEMNLENE